MDQQQQETFAETQVLAVFRKTDANGAFVYDDKAATAATVYCTIALVREGHLKMANLPPALRSLCDQYFQAQSIKVESPAKMAEALNASFKRTIPLAMMRDLNDALNKIAGAGGVEAIESLARRAAQSARVTQATSSSPSQAAMAAPKAIGIGKQKKR